VLGFKTLIKPSMEARKRHRKVMSAKIANQNHGPQAAVIRDLNPVIRGWATYYRTVVSAKVFRQEDTLLYLRLRRWARRRHPRRTPSWSGRRHGPWPMRDAWSAPTVAPVSRPIFNARTVPVVLLGARSRPPGECQFVKSKSMPYFWA